MGPNPKCPGYNYVKNKGYIAGAGQHPFNALPVNRTAACLYDVPRTEDVGLPT